MRVAATILCLQLASAMAADGGIVYDIPGLDNVAVDGRIGDWGDRGFRVDLLLPVDTGDRPLPLRPVANHDARCRLAWNREGLLVLMTVRDDKWIEEPRREALGRCDAVELYVSPKHGGRDRCQWVVAPGMDPKQGRLRWRFYDYRKDEALTKVPVTLVAARTRYGDTCSLEVLLPWKVMGVEPKVGREVAVQIWSRDSDTGRDHEHYYAVWYPKVGTFRDSTRMHRVRLAEEPSPPVLAQATFRYDLDRLQPRVRVLTQAEQAGRKVSLAQAGKEVATATLTKNDTGRASADMLIPLPRVGQPFPAANIRLGERVVGTLEPGSLRPVDLSRALAISFREPGRTDWRIKLAFDGPKLAEIAAQAGGERRRITVAEDGRSVSIDAMTRWSPCKAVLALDGPPSGKLVVEANGKTQAFALGDLAKKRATLETGPREAGVMVSAVPSDVALCLARATRIQGQRSEAAGYFLAAATEFRGTDAGADALIEAAGTYAGDCTIAPLHAREGWDNAIALYGRIMRDCAGTKHAANARWCAATCTGCWARYGCCFQNQGKQDWAKAMQLYRELYETATDAGSKCNALRRIAEIQCNRTGQWREGLANYQKILAELPGQVPKSPYWTGRTCGTHNGRWLIDRDLLDFTFPRVMTPVKQAGAAEKLRAEFVKLAPDLRTIRFHTLWHLGKKLRSLGAEDRAKVIEAKLGRCTNWLVIGPFDNNQGVMAKTVYGPEKDFLAGKIELQKLYGGSLDTGAKGKCMWIAQDTVTFGRIWRSNWQGGENSGLYALTYLNSPSARDAELRIGSSGPIRAWLNREVVLDTEGDDFSILDQFVAPLKLRPGANELFLKLSVATGFCENHVRITDSRGAAFDGVTYFVPAVPPDNERNCDLLRGDERSVAEILGPDYIREWLVCGPFPSPPLPAKDRARIAATGYEHVSRLQGGHLTDFLAAAGGEAAARPAEGDTVKRSDGAVLKWTRYTSSSDVMSFEKYLRVSYSDSWPYHRIVMYGYTTIDSAGGGPAYLEIGSDDSGKLFLNGELVHDTHVLHCTMHRDFVPVTLREGPNTILMKAENCGGPGGFIVRCIPVDADGCVPLRLGRLTDTIRVEPGAGDQRRRFTAVIGGKQPKIVVSQ